MFKTCLVSCQSVFDFVLWSFEFVSCFGFRISDFYVHPVLRITYDGCLPLFIPQYPLISHPYGDL